MSDQPTPEFPPAFQHSPSLIPQHGAAPSGEAPFVTTVAPPPVSAPLPPAYVAPIPADSHAWSGPQWGERPRVLGAVGVASIIIASLSGFFGLALTMYGFVFYMATVALSSRAAWGASPGAPTGTIVTPRSPAVAPAKRQAVILSLTRKHPIDDPRRLAQLDAIVAAAGNGLGAEAVLENGTMPDERDGERGADYFVTTRGRLELFNDRAVFFPVDGSDTVRVSAPKDGSKSGSPATDVAGGVGDEDVEEDGDVAPSAAGPAGMGPAAAGSAFGALPPAEARAIVRQAQAVAGTATGSGPGGSLNPQQVATLQALVLTPGQQLVAPGATRAAVVSCVVQADGTAALGFGNGSILVLGPRGNVISQVNPGALTAGLAIEPLSVALFIATAVLSVGLSIVLLVAGILILGRSRSGRRLHLIYACLKVPAALAGGVAIAYLVYELSKGSTGQPASGGIARGAAGLMTAMVPTLLALIYPVVLLFVLNAKSVRDYYRSLT